MTFYICENKAYSCYVRLKLSVVKFRIVICCKAVEFPNFIFVLFFIFFPPPLPKFEKIKSIKHGISVALHFEVGLQFGICLFSCLFGRLYYGSCNREPYMNLVFSGSNQRCSGLKPSIYLYYLPVNERIIYSTLTSDGCSSGEKSIHYSSHTNVWTLMEL